MTGILQAIAASGRGGVVPSFTAWNVIGGVATGTVSKGVLNFYATGKVDSAGTGPNDTSTAGSPAWWAPIQGGNMLGLYIRATLTAGPVPNLGSAMSTWVSMDSGVVNWGLQGPTSGFATSTVTIEIARDAAGANIIFFSTGNQISYTHV
jgi:hypothetical protein